MTENCSCCHPATHRPLRRPGAQGGAAEPLVGAAASCPLCDPSAVCSSACPARAEAQPLPGHLQLPGQGLLSWGSSWELGAGVTRKAGSDWGRGLWQGCGGSPSAVAKAPDPPGVASPWRPHPCPSHTSKLLTPTWTKPVRSARCPGHCMEGPPTGPQASLSPLQWLCGVPTLPTCSIRNLVEVQTPRYL